VPGSFEQLGRFGLVTARNGHAHSRCCLSKSSQEVLCRSALTFQRSEGSMLATRLQRGKSLRGMLGSCALPSTCSSSFRTCRTRASKNRESRRSEQRAVAASIMCKVQLAACSLRYACLPTFTEDGGACLRWLEAARHALPFVPLPISSGRRKAPALIMRSAMQLADLGRDGKPKSIVSMYTYARRNLLAWACAA